MVHCGWNTTLNEALNRIYESVRRGTLNQNLLLDASLLALPFLRVPGENEVRDIGLECGVHSPGRFRRSGVHRRFSTEILRLSVLA